VAVTWPSYVAFAPATVSPHRGGVAPLTGAAQVRTQLAKVAPGKEGSAPKGGYMLM